MKISRPGGRLGIHAPSAPRNTDLHSFMDASRACRAVTPDSLFADVGTALEALARAGARHDGLLPSILRCETAELPETLPESIPGQRNSDRSYPGCNLLADQDVIQTLDAVADPDGRFDAAADRYLETFTDRCTDTTTGLFPWGDHAFWHLREERVGDSYRLRSPDREPTPVHDQRLQAPFWLWERLAAHDEAVVRRFADGLDYHWNDDERTTYDRHAYIERRERNAFGPSDRGTDFPRHSGYFVLDLAAADVLCGDGSHREQLRRFADYWWTDRDERGLLPYESRGNTGGSPEQTLSLACSLLDAAEVLRGSDDAMADLLETRAETYLDGVAAAAQAGSPLWGSGYPNAVRAAKGLAYLSAWRHTGADWLTDRAIAIGHAYRRVPLPTDRPVRAADPGLALELLVQLHEVTGAEAWLDAALTLAETVRDSYLEETLPRAAIGVEQYEAQLGSGTLLRALARVAMVASEDRSDSLGPGFVDLPAGYQRTETHEFGTGWG